jgi:SWI/SNF-related matrix-associated actin-dependent regulator of chromatin subfamily A-like protein 1
MSTETGSRATYLLPLVQVGDEQAFSEAEVVYILTRYLAGKCDGARVVDGVGFNKIHTAFGHQMADTPLRYWTDRQLWAARKILETYKNTQLAAWWSVVPDIAEPAKRVDPREESYREWRQKNDPTWTPQPEYRRMVIAEQNGHKLIELQQNYDAALIERIKMIPQRRYDGNRKMWLVPIHMDTLEALTSFAIEYNYEIAADVETAITETLTDFSARIELSHAADGDYQVETPEGLALYPFQRIGVQYAEKVGNVLIADQMGLGKTVQALMTLNVSQSFPAVVVCPASLKQNWRRESKKWLPEKKVAILNGTKSASLRNARGESLFDVIIVNYDVLGGWKEELIALSPFAVIADECHEVKSPKAQRTKNLHEILEGCPKARRIFLSGTPVVNRPMEFWTLIRLLGYSREMGGLTEYKRRYDTTYASRLKELNTRARTYFMIRRLKIDVLPELPPKQRTPVPIEITNRAEYDAAEQDIAGYFATKKIQDDEYTAKKLAITMDAFQKGLEGEEANQFVKTRMSEEYSARFNMAYLIAAQNEELLRWEALKQLAVRGKMKGVFAWLDEFMESEEKLVVFGDHTSVIEDIARRYNAPIIYGDTSLTRRDQAEYRFTNDPSCRMIVGNMRAMGQGLNLQVASNVAFVEFGWNPKTHDQAEDRCHRIGTKDNVTVWNLVAEQTIDEELCALIEKKRVITDAIQDGEDAVKQVDMMNELRASLATRLGHTI